MPMVDAAPLAAANELGLFQARGLHAELLPQPGWAAIDDRLVSGTLAAVWLAIEAEAGSISEWLAAVACRGRAAGTPLRFAIVFAFSSHNYLLRHLLAEAGLDPDCNVAVQVVPPPLGVGALLEGQIDGFRAGEPWGSRAQAVGAGRIWPGYPEKVLGFAADLVAHEPELVVNATAGVLAPGTWLEDPRNDCDAARLLAERMEVPAGVKLCPDLLPPGLQGQGVCPYHVQARIWFCQMRRWDHLSAEASEGLLGGLWRPDLWATATRLAGLHADPPAGKANWPPLSDHDRTPPSLSQKDFS
jgi:hypothetical protein